MRTRLTASVLALLLLLVLCGNSPSVARLMRRVAGRRSSQKPLDPHIFASHLRLELSEVEPKTSPPTLVVTATNLHDSTTLSLLLWDTPFDDKALSLGVFKILDLTHDFTFPPAGTTLNRALPPPKDAFLEMKPLHAWTKIIQLEDRGLQFEKNVEYAIQARGRWKGVWHADVDVIGDTKLKLMGGGTGVVSLDFESNVLLLKG